MLVAETNEHVDALNATVQAERRLLGQVGRRSARIAGSETVSIGDVVATRRNDRQLRTDRGEPVRNRKRWTVTAVSTDGDLTLSHVQGHGRVRVPADYAHRHVRLGYAATAHGHEGEPWHQARKERDDTGGEEAGGDDRRERGREKRHDRDDGVPGLERTSGTYDRHGHERNDRDSRSDEPYSHARGRKRLGPEVGGTPLNAPITGMIAYGNGYLMVAADGGVFTFADRPFRGSLGDARRHRRSSTSPPPTDGDQTPCLAASWAGTSTLASAPPAPALSSSSRASG